MEYQSQAGNDDENDELPAELRLVARRYARQPVPQPTPQETTQLVSRLLVEELALRSAVSGGAGAGWRARVDWALRVTRWRIRLLGPAFWGASALLLALALACVRPLVADGRAAWAGLVLLVPLTVTLGIAHAFRTPDRGLREVEAATVVARPEALAGVMLAILGFDCLLGIIATVALTIVQHVPLGATLLAWLGPTLLLAWLTLLVSLRWGAAPAVLVGGIPWLILSVATRLEPVGIFAPPAEALALWVRLLAAVAGVVLLVLTLMRGSAWTSPGPGAVA